MINAQYKRISDFPEYWIGTDGKVYSEKSKSFLTPHIVGTYTKYKTYRFYKNGKQYNKSVYRLLAEAFIPNPNGFDEVDHIDRDSFNNDLDNLRWVSRLENLSNKTFNPTKQFQCVETGKIYNTQTAAAKEIGCCQQAISKALKTGGSIKGFHFIRMGQEG